MLCVHTSLTSLFISVDIDQQNKGVGKDDVWWRTTRLSKGLGTRIESTPILPFLIVEIVWLHGCAPPGELLAVDVPFKRNSKLNEYELEECGRS